MSHKEISLVVQAQDSLEADEKATSFMQDTLEYEHPFFDYYSVLTDAISPLASKLETLLALHSTYDPQGLVTKFLTKVETCKAQQEFEEAGYYYHLVGDLYQNRLVDDIPFYNVIFQNYDLPADPTGWFHVPVDCHC